MISEFYRRRYGEKVYKLPVGLPVTCPNRDGTCGEGGCIFCGSIGAGYENLPDTMTVTQQLGANRLHIEGKYKAGKFIAYLQNFSNTYLPPDQFAALVEESCQPDIVGIAVATRPDCVNDRYLEILADVRQRRGVDITLELGLQTVNYRTLGWINRGHGLAEFIDATLRASHWEMGVCAHMILNLPGDEMIDVVEGAKILSALKVEQVKLHALYVVKGTRLAEMYEAGEVKLGSCEDYVERAICFLEQLDPNIALQRLIGRAPEENTLFTNWSKGWWRIREDIETRMASMDTWQGKRCDYLNGAAVKKFL
jgi:radical SAM protein (TIGR01212 family)